MLLYYIYRFLVCSAPLGLLDFIIYSNLFLKNSFTGDVVFGMFSIAASDWYWTQTIIIDFVFGFITIVLLFLGFCEPVMIIFAIIRYALRGWCKVAISSSYCVFFHSRFFHKYILRCILWFYITPLMCDKFTFTTHCIDNIDWKTRLFGSLHTATQWKHLLKPVRSRLNRDPSSSTTSLDDHIIEIGGQDTLAIVSTISY